MTANDFLKQKGIIKEGYSKWICKFEDGNEFDIGQLMDEYLAIQQKEARQLLLNVYNYSDEIGHMLPSTMPDIGKYLKDTFPK